MKTIIADKQSMTSRDSTESFLCIIVLILLTSYMKEGIVMTTHAGKQSMCKSCKHIIVVTVTIEGISNRPSLL